MKVMKDILKLRIFPFIMVVILIVFCVQPAFVISTDDSIRVLTIFHTNDTHAHIESNIVNEIGFAKISNIVKTYKKENPDTILVDAGDTFSGQTVASISKGECITKILNTLEYDAMAPGNHDFDYGANRLLELSKMLNFPIVSNNVKKNDGTNIFKPYIIKNINGIKIGIIGVTTPETAYKTSSKNVTGLMFDNYIKETKNIVDEIRDKVNVVVILTHLGVDQTSYHNSIRLAKEVPNIDVIVDGHTHTVLQFGKRVGTTLIVQAGEYTQNLGMVHVILKDGTVYDKKATLLNKSTAQSIPDDKQVINLVREIKENKSSQDKSLYQVIGNTSVILDGDREKVRRGETNLGDLLADAILQATNADIAILNGGDIRTSINAGPITRTSVYSVLPFNDTIVVEKLKGSIIKDALENGISNYPEQSGGFPHISGMVVRFDASKPAGNRIVSININSGPIDLDKEYLVATSDFLLAGGDNYTMLAKGSVVTEFPSLTDIVINYIQNKNTLAPMTDGRIMPV